MNRCFKKLDKDNDDVITVDDLRFASFDILLKGCDSNVDILLDALIRLNIIRRM